MTRLLTISFLVMFVIGTDTFLVSPLLPTLKEAFHTPDAIAGWMVAAYALGYFAFALVAAPMSDRWSRKLVMSAGLVGFAVSTLLCGFATGFWSMILFRVLAGVSAAFAAPQVWATIATLLPPSQVVRGMGVATAGLAVSQALGVPIGSWLGGISWHTPFFAIAAATVVLVMLVQAMVPTVAPTVTAKPTDPVQRWSWLAPYRLLFRTRGAMMAFLAYFAFQFGNFGRFSYLGLWMHQRFGLSEAGIGFTMLWFGLGNIAGSTALTRFSERLGTARTLTYGLSIVTLTSLLVPLSPAQWVADACWFVTAAAFGSMFPRMMHLLQSLAPNQRGAVSSFANAVMYGGSFLGTSAAGALFADDGGFGAICVFSAVCFSLALLGFRAVSRLAARDHAAQNGTLASVGREVHRQMEEAPSADRSACASRNRQAVGDEVCC